MSHEGSGDSGPDAADASVSCGKVPRRCHSDFVILSSLGASSFAIAMCRSCRAMGSAKLLRSSGLDQRLRACGGTICRFFALSGARSNCRCGCRDFVTMSLTLRPSGTIL